jgi:outer membrane protein TolC
LKIYPILLTAVFSGSGALAQQVDIDTAIEWALTKNYDIKVATFGREIEQNLAERGNAGYLPTVYLDANGNYLLENTDITFPSPDLQPISAEGAQTISLNAAAVVNYTVFNGGKRLYTFRTLQSQSEDGRLRERLAMESTSLTVATRFLDALRLSDAMAINSELVTLSNERLQRAKENYSYGNFTRLQLLNAEVDLRTDSVTLAEAQLEYAQAIRELNLAIGLPADTTFALDSNFAFVAGLDKAQLLEAAKAKNSIYLRSRNDVYAAEQTLKASEADQMPVISAVGGYRYNYNKFEASFLEQQETAGWNAGLNLRFYIFDGGRIQRNIQNAKLSVQMAEVEQARAENEIAKLINNAYDSYITGIELFNLSRRNLDLAVSNFERSREAFSTGQITGIELRDAQLNLARARYEISVRRIRAKLAETVLLFEAGALLE